MNKILCCLISLLLLVGCNAPKENAFKKYNEQQTSLNNSIKDDAQSIINNGDEIKQTGQVPQDVKDKAQAIIDAGKNIINSASKLGVLWEKAIKQADSNESKLKAKVEQLEKEKASHLNKLFSMVIFWGLVGVGISGALFFSGNKSGILIGLSCLISVIAAIFLSTYLIYVLWLSGLILIGGVIYLVINYRKKDKANLEIIESVNLAKPAIDWKTFKDIANKIQSKSTKALIDSMK